VPKFVTAALAFRRAALPDLPTLKALVESAYRGNAARGGWTHEADLIEGERISAPELAALLGDDAQHVLLAEADGALLGTVTITDCGEGRAYLGMLAVDPACQAAGLGRQVIAAGEDAARALGARRMEMTVIAPRAELIAYYERRGYARTGEMRGFPVAGYKHLQMVVLAKAL